MAVSKANQRAVNKYVKNNYDRINVTMPKGKKDAIQARAEAQGQSVNAYINIAIDEKIAREATGSPTSHIAGGAVSLPSETEKRAPTASEDRTEGINAASSDKLEGKE